MPFVCILHREKKKYDCCIPLDFCTVMKSKLRVSELVMSFVCDGSSAPSTTAEHVFHSYGYCGVCCEVLGSDQAELSAATLELDCEWETNYPGLMNGLF